jgi:hypothetical protein
MAKKDPVPSYRPPTATQVKSSLKEASESTMERLRFLGVIPIRPRDILVEGYVEVPTKLALVEIALSRPEKMLPIVVEPFHGGYMILDGHHRLEAVMEVRLPMIWVVVVKIGCTARAEVLGRQVILAFRASIRGGGRPRQKFWRHGSRNRP